MPPETTGPYCQLPRLYFCP